MAPRKNLFEDKLKENYENIGDFMKRSKIPVSMETVRRLITDRKPVNTTSLLMIAKYLGFTNEEIRDILLKPNDYILRDAKEMKFVKDFISLMGFGGVEISDHDKILLGSMQELAKISRPAFNLAIYNIMYLCKAEGVPNEELSILIHPSPETASLEKRRR